MSIHSINQPFIRPNYAPNAMDFRQKRSYQPPYQPPLRYFFGGVIGTSMETALKNLMNRRAQ